MKSAWLTLRRSRAPVAFSTNGEKAHCHRFSQNHSCAVTICHRTKTSAGPFDVAIHLNSKYRAIVPRIQVESMTVTPAEHFLALSIRAHSRVLRPMAEWHAEILAMLHGQLWTSPAPQSVAASFPKTSPDDITDRLTRTLASLPLMQHVAFPNISITPKCLVSDLWRPDAGPVSTVN